MRACELTVSDVTGTTSVDFYKQSVNVIFSSDPSEEIAFWKFDRAISPRKIFVVKWIRNIQICTTAVHYFTQQCVIFILLNCSALNTNAKNTKKFYFKISYSFEKLKNCCISGYGLRADYAG